MNDTEWAELIQNNPKAAFEYLAEQFGSLVYAIVINKIGRYAPKEDIEDCVSDIFAEIFLTSKNYSVNCGSLKSYVSIIAKHRAIDKFRELSGRKTDSFDDENITLPPANDDTESETEKRLIKRKLWETIISLGSPDSDIIVYHYYYNMTFKEIAKKLSKTETAVRKRNQRAIKKLEKLLGKGEFYE